MGSAIKQSQQTIPFSAKFNLFIESLYKSFYESSLFSKIFYSSLLGLILFGDYLDRQFVEYSNPNGLYSFLADSPEETIMNLCQTGDVIVFQRPVLSFNPLNILRTSLRQFACGGPYDHCGLIVHNGHDNNFPFVVEIDQNYQNKLRITAFDERILTAREPAIFVRQIHKSNISKLSKHKFSDWIDYRVNGSESVHNQTYIDEVEQFMQSLPHKRDSIFRVLMTLCFNGDNTVKIRSAIRDLTRKIRQNEFEIETQIKQKRNGVDQGKAPRNVGMHSMVNKRHGRVKNMDALIKDTRILKLQRVLKTDNLKKREKNVRQSMRINSSQWVGFCWRYLEILADDGAKPWEIRPQQFADSKMEIPFVGSTRLGHVQFVKTHNEEGKINDSERRFRSSKMNKWEQAEKQSQ